MNPTLSQLLGVDETVVIVDLKLQFPNMAGRMSVCLPGSPGQRLRGDQPGESHAPDQYRGQVGGDFRQAAGLQAGDYRGAASAQLSLSDIYHLNVGDVIDLGQPKESPIYLEIGGYHWFTGKMGTHKKNMAVKIDEVCYQLEQRSE